MNDGTSGQHPCGGVAEATARAVKLNTMRIPRIGTGDDSYTLHGVSADVIHELRKCKDWQDPELYADDRYLHKGELGRVDDRVYCLVVVLKEQEVPAYVDPADSHKFEETLIGDRCTECLVYLRDKDAMNRCRGKRRTRTEVVGIARMREVTNSDRFFPARLLGDGGVCRVPKGKLPDNCVGVSDNTYWCLSPEDYAAWGAAQ